ncbi:MAG: packaged DNA stabilization protein, partial [Methylococcales bacterium]
YGGFPSPHIPAPVFIDGYVMLAKAGTADIYNCYLENVDSWSPTDFITSEMFPDDIKTLARQNNQVVAIGEYGTEFFFDNGANQLSGSPLARNQNTFLQIGTPAPNCIGQSEQHCFFIGVSLTGGRTLWKLDGFNAARVGTPAIDRVLTEEGTNIVNSSGYLIRTAGHFFFVICLTSRTLVYDVELDLWHEWTSTTQSRYNTSQIDGDAIDVLAINDNGSNNSIFLTTAFAWRLATDTCSCANNGKMYVLHESDGRVAYFDQNTYQDTDQIIRCEVNTSVIDFGNYKRKFLHRLTVLGDLASNVIFIKWTDDDYQTWSNLKYLSVAIRPVFHRLGSFRRRAFNIYYTDNSPLRLDGLEFVYSEGSA